MSASTENLYFMLGAFLASSAISISCAAITNGAITDRSEKRGTEACRPAKLLNASRGVATCSDGRVFRWREGYTVPVGKSGGVR